jgi:YggT family protein
MLVLLFVTFVDLFVPLFSALVIVRVVASYVSKPDGRFLMGMQNLTEPLLAPVRRVLPLTPGFDLAPLVTLLLLQGLQLLVDSLVH